MRALGQSALDADGSRQDDKLTMGAYLNGLSDLLKNPSLTSRAPQLSVSCHLVETRPHQVRVARVFALWASLRLFRHKPYVCHLVETRPRQVRVTRVFALLSAQLCRHSTKAH